MASRARSFEPARLRAGWFTMLSRLVKPEPKRPSSKPRRLPLIAGQFRAEAAKYTHQAGAADRVRGLPLREPTRPRSDGQAKAPTVYKQTLLRLALFSLRRPGRAVLEKYRSASKTNRSF